MLRWPVQQLWRLEIRPTQVKPLEDVENYFTEHKDEPRGRRVFRAQSRRYELGSLNLANKDDDCDIFCSRLAFLKALRQSPHLCVYGLAGPACLVSLTEGVVSKISPFPHLVMLIYGAVAGSFCLEPYGNGVTYEIPSFSSSLMPIYCAMAHRLTG